MAANSNKGNDSDHLIQAIQAPALTGGNGLVLGIFVKEPIPGTVKTRLGKEIGNEKAAKLYELFVKDLLSRFQLLPDHMIIGYSPNSASAQKWVASLSFDANITECWVQPEGDLGQRMSDFFEHAFANPQTETVVLIGSDSPTVPIAYLEQAYEWLYQKDCVIGPSSDGGYYLIGLRKSCKELFQNMNWSQPSLLKQSVEKLRQTGLSLKLLPVWYDIDSKDDLQMLQGHLLALKFTKQSDLPKLTTNWLSDWNTQK